MTGDAFCAVVAFEDLELDLQGGGAGDRAGADAQQHGIERVLLAGRVAELHQAMGQAV